MAAQEIVESRMNRSSRTATGSRQLVEQGFCHFEIGVAKPSVDRGKRALAAASIAAPMPCN